jgi:cytochrome c
LATRHHRSSLSVLTRFYRTFPMKLALTIVALAASCVVSIAHAAGGPSVDPAAAAQIATKNACFGCHQVNRAVVGPSFQQIASKYRTDPGAEPKLMQKIKQGGSGVWGMLPMPSHPNMNDADIRTVTQWILAGAPK